MEVFPMYASKKYHMESMYKKTFNQIRHISNEATPA